jgi:hypothetical protein
MLPSRFFSNKDEAFLADEIWMKAPHWPTQVLTLNELRHLPWTEQRVVKAGLIAITMRHAPKGSMVHDLPSLKRCDAREQANVEHFWCSALITTITPGAFNSNVAHLANFVWDGLVSPTAKLLRQPWTKDPFGSIRKQWHGWLSDMEQLLGPDANGITFAKHYMSQKSEDRATAAVRNLMKKPGQR